MRKISLVFIFIGVVFLFRNLFLPGVLVWGDAPFFYIQNFKGLVGLPLAWITRGNAFGAVNLFLFIHPLMVIYGILGNYLHFSNDFILRVLFYFPSLIFGFLGVYLFTKQLKFSTTVSFFSVLLYLVNTYYLLLIDGGQVGVVLAYGLFPLVLYFIVKSVDKESIHNFLLALFFSLVLTAVDFRVSAICLFTAFIIKRKLKILALLFFLLVGLSLYWVLPVLKLTTSSISTEVASLQTTSLLNAFYLFSPNWPLNQFGKTIAPYFYFSIVPILIFLPLFIVKSKKVIWLTVYFLIFAFLAKGASNPVGGLYALTVNTRFGSVMRDSTKFFIPLILFGGILVGISVEEISKKLKKKNLSSIFQGMVFVFVFVLVWQALSGKLNGVLGKSSDISSYQKVQAEVSSQDGFLRSAWFTEKSPFAFHTEEKQAIDAKDLVNFRPFATMNVGTGDRFNFINNSNYLDWFNLMGIKYLVLNGNPRVTSLSKSDSDDWQRLNKLVSSDMRLKKVDIGTTFPIYETPNIHPNKFFVDKTFVVLGGDDIYQRLGALSNKFSVGNQGFLFIDDGKFDPSNLQSVASTSAVLIFNNASKEDLKMSFLQKNFVEINKSPYSQWAMRKSEDYLNWKFELLTKGIDQHEFDYGKGIAFSTVAGEKIDFKLNVPEDGNYYLAVRSMSASDSASLEEDFNATSNLIDHKNFGVFEWSISGSMTLKKGNKTLTLKNTGGVQIVNTAALVGVSDMKAADQLVQNLLGFFGYFDINNVNDRLKLKRIVDANKWEELNGTPTKLGWIVYTDSFNSNWILSKRGEDFTPYPLYSMVNGFYFDPKWGDVDITFKGSDEVRWGIYWSGFTLVVVIIIVLWVSSKEKHK